MNIFYEQKNIKINKKSKKRGFSLVEVLIACAIISASTFALVSASTQGLQLSREALRQTQANFLAEEGAEAVKSIRDDSWANISSLIVDTNYYLTFDTNTNKWSLVTTNPGPIDSLFTRTIILRAVNRDANDDIAASGTLDPNTKKIDINISWTSSNTTTSSKDLSLYISDIFN